MDHKILLDALENPEVLEQAVSEQAVSRREAFRGGGKLGVGLALASMPVLMAAFTKQAFAQSAGLPTKAVNVLNFALLLEYLEADFYNQGLASGVIPGPAMAVYQQIADHENAHVAFLKAVLGDQAIPEPVFDFTAGGMFDPFNDYPTFLLLSQAYEDTGVRAYKGQAPTLYQLNVPANPTAALLLTSALRIHSVEARHAAEVRRLRGLESWIPSNQPGAPAPVQAVYAGEDNTTHAGIDALMLPTLQPFLMDNDPLTGVTREQVTEAFDEPLSAQAVLAIAAPFATGRLKTSTTFTVRVENVSQPGTVSTDRLNGVVPLSPGAFAVYDGDDPMFTVGEMADQGTELIAEDGFPMTKAAMLKDVSRVTQSGVFTAPGGSSGNPALGPGETAEFVVNGNPGQRLQFETMFVQSNDWFYGFGNGGLALFDGDTPISGEMTSELVLYDAGTEEDTAPGTGPFQKPVQDPEATDVGPAESVPIAPAGERHPGFTIPDTSSVIRVTVMPR